MDSKVKFWVSDMCWSFTLQVSSRVCTSKVEWVSNTFLESYLGRRRIDPVQGQQHQAERRSQSIAKALPLELGRE